MRLDRALANDVRAALRSRPILFFLGLELLAGVIFVARRGSEHVDTVALIWVGMGILAFFAWWAGRHRLAHPLPDRVGAAGARAVSALLGSLGMVVWTFGISVEAGFVLLVCGMGGWLWAAWRSGGFHGLRERLTRDFRPFLPLLLLIGLPRLLFGGPFGLVAAVLTLPSGVGQQLLYLTGLFAPLEAVLRRSDLAAVAAALLFGLIHVPLIFPDNDGDLLAAFANAVIFQASVGLIACLAYVRHRAVVPIGVAHGLAIG